MIRIVNTLILFFGCQLFVYAQLTITGIVLDKDNRPVPYAHVGVLELSVGTHTNSEGKFVLTVATKDTERKMYISHVNYETYHFTADQLTDAVVRFVLTDRVVNLTEVVISGKQIDPYEILMHAIDSTNAKFISPVQLQVYLREFSKKNNQFYYFADALVDYYLPATKNKSDIQVRVNESRARKIKLKLDSGLNHDFPHQFDIKSLPNYRNPQKFNKFFDRTLCDFKLTEAIDAHDSLLRIQFTPKPGQNKFYYEGTVFIDKKEMIIRSFKAKISESFKENTPEGKIFSLRSKLIEANVHAEYALLSGRCYPNQVRLDAVISITNGKGVTINYQYISEMNTRDLISKNAQPIQRKERFKYNQLSYMSLSNDGNHYRTEFWKNQNGQIATRAEEEIINSLSKPK